jgi:hypothetical protein
MRVINDPGPEAAGGAFAELLRLQGEFQARLADETLRYLRRLQAMTGPSNPGTVVRAADGEQLEASAQTGERVEFALEVENRQKAYGSVAPALTPLLGDDGTSWFPAAEVRPPSTLIPPAEVVEIVVSVDVPEQVPAGRYRGALLLQGFRQDALPVVIKVQASDEPVREGEAEPSRGTGKDPDRGTGKDPDRETGKEPDAASGERPAPRQATEEASSPSGPSGPSGPSRDRGRG